MGTLELIGTTFSLVFGGDKRDRTADLLHAMQALSQLSYTPKMYNGFCLFTCARQLIIIVTNHSASQISGD